MSWTQINLCRFSSKLARWIFINSSIGLIIFIRPQSEKIFINSSHVSIKCEKRNSIIETRDQNHKSNSGRGLCLSWNIFMKKIHRNWLSCQSIAKWWKTWKQRRGEMFLYLNYPLICCVSSWCSLEQRPITETRWWFKLTVLWGIRNRLVMEVVGSENFIADNFCSEFLLQCRESENHTSAEICRTSN